MKKFVLGFCVLLMGLFAACGKDVGNDQRFLSDLSAGLTAGYAVQADQPQVQTMEELQQQDPQERRQQMLEYLRAEEKAFCKSYTFEDQALEPLAQEYLSLLRELLRQLEEPQAEVDSSLTLRQAQILYQLVQGWNVTVDAPYEENLHDAWLTGGYFCEKDAICAALEPMFAQVKLIPKGNAYTLSAENCTDYDLTLVSFQFQFYDADGVLITAGKSGYQVDEYGFISYSAPEEPDWNAGETREVTFTPAAKFSKVEMRVSFCGPFARAHLPSPASTEFYEIKWEK